MPAQAAAIMAVVRAQTELSMKKILLFGLLAMAPALYAQDEVEQVKLRASQVAQAAAKAAVEAVATVTQTDADRARAAREAEIKAEIARLNKELEALKGEVKEPGKEPADVPAKKPAKQPAKSDGMKNG
jgi:hypothetical protein